MITLRRSVLVLLALAHRTAAQDAALEVRVDPRVELVSLVFRLAGAPEYSAPVPSAYAERVEAHFGELRDHPAVSMARALRRTRGVSFDAPMSLAMHVTDPPALKERAPFDGRPPRLDQRWRTAEAREFLAKLRDFATASGFGKFFADNREYYDAVARHIAKRANERDYIAWFDRFFGARPQARFALILGLLNGNANYGTGIRFHDGREEITPVLGVYRFDAERLPVFGAGFVPLLVHELCHSYTNPLVDRFESELEKAGKLIYGHYEAAMRQQAYGNWQTMMYESLVRACVVRYMLANDGETAARNRIAYDEGRGFAWTGDLARLLADYEQDRERYPSLADFMPRVVAFFDAYPARLAALPKVVSMTPANGAPDVDPELGAITITFDRPMQAGSWSVVKTGAPFPEVAGAPRYDEARKVLTIPVRLKPGTQYGFSLNGGTHRGFRSAEGGVLVPVAVTFRTR